MFCTSKSESNAFSMEMTSFVDTTTPGTAIAMSTTVCQYALSDGRCKRTASPNKSISLCTINQRTLATSNGIVIVPSNINRRLVVLTREPFFAQMNERISGIWFNRTDLVRIRSGIPHAIEQLICNTSVFPPKQSKHGNED